MERRCRRPTVELEWWHPQGTEAAACTRQPHDAYITPHIFARWADTGYGESMEKQRYEIGTPAYSDGVQELAHGEDTAG